MRDPTTAIDIATTKKLTDITVELLSERKLADLMAEAENLVRDMEEIGRRWQELGCRMKELMSASSGEGKPKVEKRRRPARKRGRPPQHRWRHVQIATAVAMLVTRGIIYPTRSHFGRRRGGPSACSIVAAALKQLGEHLDERTVEGIWNRYKHKHMFVPRRVRSNSPELLGTPNGV